MQHKKTIIAATNTCLIEQPTLAIVATTITARIAPTGCRDDRPVYTPYNEQQKVFNTYQSSKRPVGNLRGTVANIDETFQVYDISLLLHLSIELFTVTGGALNSTQSNSFWCTYINPRPFAKAS